MFKYFIKITPEFEYMHIVPCTRATPIWNFVSNPFRNIIKWKQHNVILLEVQITYLFSIGFSVCSSRLQKRLKGNGGIGEIYAYYSYYDISIK